MNMPFAARKGVADQQNTRGSGLLRRQCMKATLISALIVPLVTLPAKADLLLWNGSIDSNWFEPLNWTPVPGFSPSGHAVPQDGDSATILQIDGPVLTAADAAAAAVISIDMQNLYVGADDFANSGGTGPHAGSLTIEGFDFFSAQINIGASGSGEASSTGTMTVNDASLNSVSLRVGLNGAAAPGAAATGSLFLTGVSASPQLSSDNLLVGAIVNDNAGEASGFVSAAGDAEIGQVTVGSAAPATFGSATMGEAEGRLIIGGNLLTNGLLVGRAGTAGARGEGIVSVTGTLGGLEGTASFGSNIRIGHAFGEGSIANGTVTASALEQSGPLSPVNSISIGRAQNGGTATGTLVAPDGTGDLMVGNIIDTAVEVGVVRGIPGIPGPAATANGALVLGQSLVVPVADINLDQFRMDIGVLDGTGSATGSASLGGARGFMTVRVGASGSNTAGTAIGGLTIGAGGLGGSGAPFASLVIGQSIGGNAEGQVSVSGGDITGFGGTILVGASFGDASATGNLTLNSGLLDSTGVTGSKGGLLVGIADTDLNGTANGSLTVANGQLNVGGIAVGHAVGDGNGAAEGSLLITNSTVAGTNMQIGNTSLLAGGSAGRARGIARFEQSSVAIAGAGSSNVQVGNAFGGVAEGRLELIDSTLSIGNSLWAGNSFLGESQGGTVALTRSLVSVSESLMLGDAALLHIDVEGLDRQWGYGAIDVGGVAILAGDLTLDFDTLFDFEAALDETLDLIIASAFDVSNPASLTGLGFETINYLDLPSWVQASAAIVSAVDGDIFQISFNRASAAVPEPGVLAIFAIGLACIGAARLRKNA